MPQPLLPNYPIHSLWTYQMMLHGGDANRWSASLDMFKQLTVGQHWFACPVHCDPKVTLLWSLQTIDCCLWCVTLRQLGRNCLCFVLQWLSYNYIRSAPTMSVHCSDLNIITVGPLMITNNNEPSYYWNPRSINHHHNTAMEEFWIQTINNIAVVAANNPMHGPVWDCNITF